MATNAHEFQQRIARAKEAARLAALAAATPRPPALPFPPQRLPSPALHMRPPPPPPHAFYPQAPPPPPHAFYPQAPSPGVLGPPPPPHVHATVSVPDDVRNRIDRLVEFIQRNGVAFEDTVRQRERENPNFAFLTPGARFHDYFVWKKRQVCHPAPAAAAAASAMSPPPFIPARGLAAAAPPAMRPPMAQTLHSPALSADALLSAMSTGALASVCKLARTNGHAPYVPLPPELLRNTGALPSVEQGRLEIRLAEFYRQTPSSSLAK